MHLGDLTIKQSDAVILGHEDDRPNSEDHNLHLRDYTALGLRINDALHAIDTDTIAAWVDRYCKAKPQKRPVRSWCYLIFRTEEVAVTHNRTANVSGAHVHWNGRKSTCYTIIVLSQVTRKLSWR